MSLSKPPETARKSAYNSRLLLFFSRTKVCGLINAAASILNGREASTERERERESKKAKKKKELEAHFFCAVKKNDEMAKIVQYDEVLP